MKYYALLACLVVVLCSCGLLSPQQQSDALGAIDGMLKSGSITQEQWAALRAAILDGGTMAFWTQVGSSLGGAALAYFGVQIRRGPPTTDARIAEVAAKIAAKPA